MNKLQRLLCLLLSVLLLTAAPLAALAEEEPADAPEAEAAEEEEYVPPEELIVGHPTVTRGDFFTEMFGNDTADIDVRALIHGYNLVNWDQNQGVYVFDPSVVETVGGGADDQMLVEIDARGDHTYRIKIAEDLKYSDGTPITAADYAFSILLMMSPELEDERIGAKIYRAEHLLGYNDYIATRKKVLAGGQIEEGDIFYLSGVTTYGDYEIDITLDGDFLPYFFETGLLMTVPYPISVIAPGCKVYNYTVDENGTPTENGPISVGIYIANDEEHKNEAPLYTPELLAKTILDPETGYNSHPSVVSGPYKLVSWDPETGDGHFEINPEFKGAWYHNSLPGTNYSAPTEDYAGHAKFVPVLDAEGNPRYDFSGNKEKNNEVWLVLPNIEKICFKVASNDTMIGQLENDELHLVNKVTYGPTIEEGLASEDVRQQPYPRIGMSFLTFTYDWDTVHEKEVRKAIAYCMDRLWLTQQYCGERFGIKVNGYYGIEQWEYLVLTGQVAYPIEMVDEATIRQVYVRDNGEEEDITKKYKNRYAKDDAEYEKFVTAWTLLQEKWADENTLIDYSVDLDKANKLLDLAGWTLNREGGKYVAGTDDVRCKEIDGKIVALDLSMMYPDGNHMSELFKGITADMDTDEVQPGSFIDNLAQVGIKLTLVPTAMEDLFKSYYRETERTTDMIYLATNFHVIVDPAITYSTDTSLNHETWNNTYSDDEDLFAKAKDMRQTEPGDVYTYVSKWVDFQVRYNEVLPAIPIYSNIYYDFFVPELQNYYVTSQVTWSQAILPAYFGLEAETAPEVEEEEEDGDFESFD